MLAAASASIAIAVRALLPFDTLNPAETDPTRTSALQTDAGYRVHTRAAGRAESEAILVAWAESQHLKIGHSHQRASEIRHIVHPEKQLHRYQFSVVVPR